MKNITISDKIMYVDTILHYNANMRTYRYFKDIIKYIDELKYDNEKLYKTNIHLVDELNDIKNISRETQERW